MAYTQDQLQTGLIRTDDLDYPWLFWLNGDVWVLRPGVHFHEDVKAFQARAHQRMRRTRSDERDFLRTRFNKKTGLFYIQAWTRVPGVGNRPLNEVKEVIRPDDECHAYFGVKLSQDPQLLGTPADPDPRPPSEPPAQPVAWTPAPPRPPQRAVAAPPAPERPGGTADPGPEAP